MLPGKCLHEVLEVRARNISDRIAVSTLEEQITYGNLNILADRLAQRLRTLGVGPDVLVGLCIDRSIEMVIAVLAILKAGGAYVPIDPTYPSKRIQFLLTDSSVDIVVTISHVAACLGECRATVVCLDEEQVLTMGAAVTPTSPTEVDPKNLAYVIYTSGSTGVPKGVLVEHHHVLRLFEQTDHWFQFDEHDIWTLFHSPSFDFSVWEMWGALLYGGRLIIVPYDITRSPVQFYTLLRTAEVTILNQTPSAFRRLVASNISRVESADLGLRLVIFGGEALDINILKPWIAGYGESRPVLVNMYGITETTVHVTYKRILKEGLERHNLSPIGRRIPDLQIHILAANGEPVEDGVPGELYVGGSGVTRGYLNRPELTADRFVPGPGLTPDESRLYYSGDRIMRMPDGELTYYGRSDDQMKVRGFRIEPREVELCLRGHPDISSATVVPHDYGDGDIRLMAYVVPKPGLVLDEHETNNLTADLIRRAATELPIYMRPSAYFICSEIPITAHGKVDREALRQEPRLCRDSNGNTTGFTITEAITEEVITGIWENILQRKGIGRQDDFFDSGGTSLALILIFESVNKYFNLSLDPGVLSEEATIARLSDCVASRLRSGQAQYVGRHKA